MRHMTACCRVSLNLGDSTRANLPPASPQLGRHTHRGPGGCHYGTSHHWDIVLYRGGARHGPFYFAPPTMSHCLLAHHPQ
jgi:hypothetical protein